MKFKVPYVDFPLFYSIHREEISAAFDTVMSSGRFILKSEVELFENKVSTYAQSNHAIGLNSGTDALYLAAHLMNLKPGDEVITVAHTFVATVAAIKLFGGTPVFVDVGEDHNIDVQQIEKAITKKTVGIIPVHMNGRVCDMDTIQQLADQYGLWIIEDAAQAIGAKYNKKMAGTFGKIGCFSMHPMKVLGGAGDAGMALTQSEEIADRLKIVRNHGQRTKEDVIEFGFNSRLDNLQASILLTKFKYLDQWITRRREIAKIYDQSLAGISDIVTPYFPEKNGKHFDVYSSYPIQVRDPSKRNALIDALKEASIECFIHWPTPVHKHPKLNLSQFNLPKTESLSASVISIPVHELLTDQQVGYTVDSIKNFFKR